MGSALGIHTPNGASAGWVVILADNSKNSPMKGDVKLWVIHRSRQEARSIYKITGHPSMELAVEHVRALLIAGAHVRGIYDRDNKIVMGEADIAHRFGEGSTSGNSN
jgi:hypothetical protein